MQLQTEILFIVFLIESSFLIYILDLALTYSIKLSNQLHTFDLEFCMIQNLLNSLSIAV